MMTKEEAQQLAQAVRNGLPWRMRQKLKAIHIMPKLHEGHLTFRVFCHPSIAEDPDPYIFAAEEIANG